MIYVYCAILAVYLVLFLLSMSENGNPFQRIAAHIFRKQQERLRKTDRGRKDWKRALYARQLGEKLKTLQPGIAVEKQIREHYLALYTLVLMVVFVGDLFCLAAWFSAHSAARLSDGGYLPRNACGEGDVEVGLKAEIPGLQEEIFAYLLEERRLTEEELEKTYAEASALLPQVILGGNTCLEDVREDLELVSGLEGYPFQISWESSAYSLVNTDGIIHNEELTGSEVVTLTAKLRYEEWFRELQIPVQVHSAVYTPEEVLRMRMEELLRESGESSRSGEVMVLPEQIGTEPVIWSEIIEDSSGYFLILVMFAAGVLYWGRGRELDQKLEARKRELLLDYPEVVNKLALYMGAGMTVRNAFLKLGEDYKKQKEERKKYVYEEILMTCYELQSGRSETEAYAHFGKRCQVQPYMKLSALLSQNIRKGSNNLLQILRQEADHAFAERKNQAKKLGEEAGTKLLLPMMMMLCVVMVIIMIPAYFSFTLN